MRPRRIPTFDRRIATTIGFRRKFHSVCIKRRKTKSAVLKTRARWPSVSVDLKYPERSPIRRMNVSGRISPGPQVYFDRPSATSHRDVEFPGNQLIEGGGDEATMRKHWRSRCLSLRKCERIRASLVEAQYRNRRSRRGKPSFWSSLGCIAVESTYQRIGRNENGRPSKFNSASFNPLPNRLVISP